jgi:solute carrier family 12 sodium/potassium/chloride transporter 2
MAKTTAKQEKRLQKEVEEKITQEAKPSRKLFGTFGGVFTPTLLTILGVIMYLRQGWVVGNAGLLGAWLIILLSFGITAFTGFSLSSITTNIRIGAGGAFNIISQSLGLEVGGSVGIPLYISQTLAVAMYIFGFRAGWLWVFPEHSTLMVDFAAFFVLFGIAFISAGLAFKIQYLILAIIIGSLFSVAWAAFTGSMQHPIQWWGEFAGSPETNFQGTTFWLVFAVFFPASTGIMAGANMSGDLANPRKSIPVGTMSAIGLSLLIYLVLVAWLSMSATNKELLNSYTIMIDKAAWGPAVLAGLLGATFSSALSSLVGAPRILQALAEHKVLPKSKFFARRTAKGEPRNALVLTGMIVAAALMLRNLNAIAPMITMFFLITYAMINLVVVIEQGLKLVSFRPLLRVPRIVPILGTLGCVCAMFIVNAVFSIVSVVLVLGIHAWLIRKHLKAPFGDVRSGLFAAVAEWAAKKMENLSGPRERTWKANVLMPVEDSSEARKYFKLLRDITYPKGFVRLLGLTGKRDRGDLENNLPELAEDFNENGVFSSWSVVSAADFSENLAAGMEALGGAFFTSNLIFLRLPEKKQREKKSLKIIEYADLQDMGIILLANESGKKIEGQKPLVMLIDEGKTGWEISMELGNMDLALLIAYKLKRNWNNDLHLIARISSADDRRQAKNYLQSVVELARIPNAKIRVINTGEENDLIEKIDPSVIISSFTVETTIDNMRSQSEQLDLPFLFTMDSGKENALA